MAAKVEEKQARKRTSKTAASASALTPSPTSAPAAPRAKGGPGRRGKTPLTVPVASDRTWAGTFIIDGEVIDVAQSLRSEDLIIVGNARDVMRALPDESVQEIITSPPYYGLRGYKTAPQVWGEGEAGRCVYAGESHDADGVDGHEWGEVHPPGWRKTDTNPGKMQGPGTLNRDTLTSWMCAKCDAWKGELGLEPTPELFVQHLAELFDEAKRVLRKDGTCYVNIGDSFYGTGYGQPHTGKAVYKPEEFPQKAVKSGSHSVMKPKDLMGMPWRLAIEMVNRGWWLRSDNIWHKPNTMPHPVKDRPLNSHEHVFQFARSRNYYYDGESVKEPSMALPVNGLKASGRTLRDVWEIDDGLANQALLTIAMGWIDAQECDDIAQIQERYDADGTQREYVEGEGWASSVAPLDHWERMLWEVYCAAATPNGRDVWRITPASFKGSHFATFPPKLVERCMMPGTSEFGACAECMTPFKRVVAPTESYAKHLGKDWADDKKDDAEGRGHFTMGDGRRSAQRRTKRGAPSITAEYVTLGWRPGCGCAKWVAAAPLKLSKELTLLLEMLHIAPPIFEPNRIGGPAIDGVKPCIVLDPFFGAGTVGVAARAHGRAYMGIELSPQYAQMAYSRINNDTVLTAAPRYPRFVQFTREVV